MGRKWNILWLAAVVTLLLSGCAMRTLDDLYQVPKRSEEYNNLQSAIDQNLGSRQYCAPLSGENLQAIQMADLDGDGSNEYLLFAKGASEKPLQILVFRSENGKYVLSDIIYHHGSAFDVVEYARIDDRPGYEIIVGCQISDQVTRSVSVYSYYDGKMVAQTSSYYTRFLTCDLDANGRSELLVIQPGEAEQNRATAELYAHSDEGIDRVGQITLSQSVDRIEKVLFGGIQSGKSAVYISAVTADNTVITDVLAVEEAAFVNLGASVPGGTQIRLPVDRCLFPEDIDLDGTVELPALVQMRAPSGNLLSGQLSLIRWYSITDQSQIHSKLYSCVNFQNRWSLILGSPWAQRIAVMQTGNTFYFYLWDETYTQCHKFMTLSYLTGETRYEQATKSGRFVVYETDTAIYAAALEDCAAEHGITQESIINSFYLIPQDRAT